MSALITVIERRGSNDKGRSKDTSGWMDLIDKFEELFGKIPLKDDEGEQIDIIELAKEKEVVFSRPRWWSPSGENDKHQPPVPITFVLLS